jgi:hypothetical protein
VFKEFRSISTLTVVPSAVTIKAPPKTRHVKKSYPNNIRNVKPRKKGRRAALKDMRIESLDVSFIFSMSISNPAKNKRKIIPSTDRKSTITKEGSSLNNIPLIAEIPSNMPAKICPTTGGQPTFLNSSPNTKAIIKIIGTIKSIEAIFIPQKLYCFLDCI